MQKVGSHVVFAKPDLLLGSVKEAISYNANCLMIFNGSPRTFTRQAIEDLKINEAHQLLASKQMCSQDIIVHATYMINLANTEDEALYRRTMYILEDELMRTKVIGAKYLIVHPGNYQTDLELSLKQVAACLNELLGKYPDVCVLIETMSGREREVGKNFAEIAYIIRHIKNQEQIGVCLDTCHIHDAGYDVLNVDKVLEEFNRIIGLDKLKVIHLNDSKNPRGSKMDRHEHYGYGYIGFEALLQWYQHPLLTEVYKIDESPLYKIDRTSLTPYYQEIKMLKAGKFTDWKNRQIEFDI